jgi:hypothetical protein
MKKVTFTDDKGLLHQSVIRGEDPDELAHEGILQDPPNIVERLDWDAIKRDLHNQLVMRKLLTYDDLVRQKNGLTGAILAAVRKPVINLFKERRG